MNRFGSFRPSENTMSDDDIFVARLQLLIIMSKAFLKDFAIGEYQKKAIIENAQALFYCSLFLDHKEIDPKADPSKQENQEIQEESLFHNKIRLLAVAAMVFAEGRLLGERKKKELQNNIDYISKKITFESQIDTIEFFKSG
ncbi:MAG: hypothetical protein R6X10_03245 [Desulfobacterales bacterium]